MRRRRTPPRLRAVLLARVSTHKRSQEKSIPRQLAELGDIARRRGWAVVGKYSDRVTGAELDRPGLAAGVADIVNGRADIVVVHELDRLGRDVIGMLQTADKIRGFGGHLFIRDMNIDTSSPEGRITFTMLAGLAEFQRRSGSSKVIAGLRHARKKGIRLGRPPALTPDALERGAVLRARRRPRLSWQDIANKIRSEKLGDHDRTTVATAVRRWLARTHSARATYRAAAEKARVKSPARSRSQRIEKKASFRR